MARQTRSKSVNSTAELVFDEADGNGSSESGDEDFEKCEDDEGFLDDEEIEDDHVINMLQMRADRVLKEAIEGEDEEEESDEELVNPDDDDPELAFTSPANTERPLCDQPSPFDIATLQRTNTKRDRTGSS
jgi:hypothetical protein